MKKGRYLFIGLILLTIGLFAFYNRVSKIKAGIVTNATVLRIDRKQGGEDVLYQPTLQFINYKNQPMNYKPAWSTGDWYTGEKVKLLYTRNNYNNISILSYWGTFGFALLFFCGALVFLFVAAGEYLAGRFFTTLKSQ